MIFSSDMSASFSSACAVAGRQGHSHMGPRGPDTGSHTDRWKQQGSEEGEPHSFKTTRGQEQETDRERSLGPSPAALSSRKAAEPPGPISRVLHPASWGLFYLR